MFKDLKEGLVLMMEHVGMSTTTTKKIEAINMIYMETLEVKNNIWNNILNKKFILMNRKKKDF